MNKHLFPPRLLSHENGTNDTVWFYFGISHRNRNLLIESNLTVERERGGERRRERKKGREGGRVRVEENRKESGGWRGGGGGGGRAG